MHYYNPQTLFKRYSNATSKKLWSHFVGHDVLATEFLDPWKFVQRHTRASSHCTVLYTVEWLWLWSIHLGYTKLSKLCLKVTRFEGSFYIFRNGSMMSWQILDTFWKIKGLKNWSYPNKVVLLYSNIVFVP